MAKKVKSLAISSFLIFAVLLFPEMIEAASSASSSKSSSTNTWQSKADAIEKEALLHLGPYYKYGSAGPMYFDCSGFVQYLYKNRAGISLPRTAAQQSQVGTQVSLKYARKGDLLFFSSDGVRITHVGIYLGNGKMVHASSSKNGIRISDVYSTYYTKTFKLAKRVIY